MSTRSRISTSNVASSRNPAPTNAPPPQAAAPKIPAVSSRPPTSACKQTPPTPLGGQHVAAAANIVGGRGTPASGAKPVYGPAVKGPVNARGGSAPFAAPPTLGKVNRSTAGQFLSPSKTIIARHAKGTRDPDVKNVLKNSDLAHRLSFADIRSIVMTHRMNHRLVIDLIKTVTIPARDYGGVPKGSTDFYNYVNKNAKSKKDLIKLLNSCPFNLRPGNASANRGIGQRLDPNHNSLGRLTPLSQSAKEFQDCNPNCGSPPQKFERGTHTHPANVDRHARPAFRSSTSVTAAQLLKFERDQIQAWKEYCSRSYPTDPPFQ